MSIESIECIGIDAGLSGINFCYICSSSPKRVVLCEIIWHFGMSLCVDLEIKLVWFRKHVVMHPDHDVACNCSKAC